MNEEKLAGYMKQIDADIVEECAEFASAETAAAAAAGASGAIGEAGKKNSGTGTDRGRKGRRNGRSERSWKSVVSIAATVLLFVAGATAAIVILARSRSKKPVQSGYVGNEFPTYDPRINATDHASETSLPATAVPGDPSGTLLPSTDDPGVTSDPSLTPEDTLLYVVNNKSLSYPRSELAWSQVLIDLPAEGATPAPLYADGINPRMQILSQNMGAYTFTFNRDSTLRLAEKQGLYEYGICQYMIYDCNLEELYTKKYNFYAPVTASYAARDLTEELERIYAWEPELKEPYYVCVRVSYKTPSRFYTEKNEFFDYYAYDYVFAVKEGSYGGTLPTGDATATTALTPTATPTATAAPDVTPDHSLPFVIVQEGKTIAPYKAGTVKTVSFDGTDFVVEDLTASLDFAQISASAPIVDYYKDFSESWTNGEPTDSYYVGSVGEVKKYDGSTYTSISGITGELSKLRYYLPGSVVPNSLDVIIAVVLTERGDYIPSMGGYETRQVAYVFRITSGDPVQATPSPDPTPTSDVRIQTVSVRMASKLFIGEPAKLNCDVYPENYNVGKVSWKIVEGGEYAQIDQAAGTVKGIKKGSFTLRAYVEGTSIKYDVTITVEEKGLIYTPDTELDPKYMPEKDPQGIDGDIYDQRRYYLVYNMRTPEEVPNTRYSPYVMDMTYYVHLYGTYGGLDKSGIKVAFYNIDREYVGYSITNSSGLAMFTVKNSEEHNMYFYVYFRDREPDTSPFSKDLIPVLKGVNWYQYGVHGETGMSIYYKYSQDAINPDDVYTVRIVNKQSGETLRADDKLGWFFVMADCKQYQINPGDPDPETGISRKYILYSWPGLEDHIDAIFFVEEGYVNNEATMVNDCPRLSYKVEGMELTIYVDNDQAAAMAAY
jgi:hypothetical protein